MSSIRMNVTNNNGTGAGSLRAAVDAASQRSLISFAGAGTIPITATRLTIDAPNTQIDGGELPIAISNTNLSGGAYSTAIDSNGVVLKNLHFDNSSGPTDGSTALFDSPVDASSTVQHPSGLVQNCYFKGPGADDNVFVSQRYKTILFDRCIFDGTTSTGHGAVQVGFSDDVGPGFDMSWHVVLKHCILLAPIRIPYVRAGTCSILGCIMQKIQGPGLVFGLGRVNLVNNWMMSPSDVSYNTSVFAADTVTTVLGQTLRPGSIYSTGNYMDGIAQSDWVPTSYAASFHTDAVGAALPSSYFRRTPSAALPFVPEAGLSRLICLSKAGPSIKTVNAMSAIGKVVNRRLQDVL